MLCLTHIYTLQKIVQQSVVEKLYRTWPSPIAALQLISPCSKHHVHQPTPHVTRSTTKTKTFQRSVLSSSLDAWHLATSKHSIFLPTSKAMSKEVHPSSKLQKHNQTCSFHLACHNARRFQSLYLVLQIVTNKCPFGENNCLLVVGRFHGSRSGYLNALLEDQTSRCTFRNVRWPSFIAHYTHVCSENQFQLLPTGQEEFK